jgi:hypothetical protein
VNSAEIVHKPNRGEKLQGKELKRNRPLFGALIALAVLAVACGSDASTGNQTERLIALDVILTVVNRSTAPASVSIESDSLRHLLGDVPRGEAQSFSIPINLVNSTYPVRLEASLGASTVQSKSFVVRRGESITWTFSGQGRGTIAKQ